jgi:O-antigen ligase
LRAPPVPTEYLEEPGERAITAIPWRVLALAIAIPFLFLHGDFETVGHVSVGDTRVVVSLADLAVALLVVVAAIAGVREGFGRLRPGRSLWIAMGLLLAWILVTIAVAAGDDGYGLHANLVTWAKFAEYALLAPALPLLLRAPADFVAAFAAAAVWVCVAAVVGVTQWLGATWFDAWPAGYRQPSFLGHLDFASLACIGLAVAVAAIAFGPSWQRPRWLGVAAGIGGAVGLVLSATVAGLIGFVVAVAVTALATGLLSKRHRRRALVMAGLVVAVTVGVLALRGGDIDQFLRFTGAREKETSTVTDVQTYSHRTVLVYLGLRGFADHPLVGLGWQGSGEVRGFAPYLADAHRRFPEVAAEAFPSAEHPWGVQNAYVQALADLGAPGLLLFLAPFAAGAILAWRAVRRAPPGYAAPGAVALTLTVSLLGVWSAQSLVSGQPLDASTWIALGLAAAAVAGRTHPAR